MPAAPAWKTIEFRLPFACKGCGHQEGLITDARCHPPDESLCVEQCDQCPSPIATALFEAQLRARHGLNVYE